eukprot:s2362_g12.t1
MSKGCSRWEKGTLGTGEKLGTPMHSGPKWKHLRENNPLTLRSECVPYCLDWWCTLLSQNECWGGAFSYERCCRQIPLLSAPEVESVKKLKGQALNCGCSKPDLSHPAFKGGPFTWCSSDRHTEEGKFYQAIMLNQDPDFLMRALEMLAACPLGSLAMLLLDASLKMSNAKEPPQLAQMPSFLRAQEIVQLILDSGVSLSLFQVGDGGHNLRLDGFQSGKCAPFSYAAPWARFRPDWKLYADASTRKSPCEDSPILQTMTEGTPSILQLFLKDSDAAGAAMSMPTCPLVSPALYLLLAYSSLQQTAPDQAQLHVPGYTADEAEFMIRLGDEKLRAALSNHSALALMLVTPWPIPELLDLLSHPGRVNLTVQTAMEEILHLQEVGKFEVSAVSQCVPLLLSILQCPERPNCFFRVWQGQHLETAKVVTLDEIQDRSPILPSA